MIAGIAAKSVIALSSLGLLLAQASSAVPVDPLSSVGRFSLDACLITAVGVMWKALSRKDEALMGMIEKMAQSMERSNAGAAGLSQLRDSIEELIGLYNNRAKTSLPTPKT